MRRADGAERYLPYDLLVGADGIRSAVRAGLVSCHRDFECSVSDIFARFKSVHVARPPTLAAQTVVVFPQVWGYSVGRVCVQEGVGSGSGPST